MATAIAILRSKPEGVNVKQYVQQLCDDYKQGQEQYRIRYLQAKETILQLRQQQIIAFSQAHNGLCHKIKCITLFSKEYL